MHPVGVNFCILKVVDGQPRVLLQQRDENSSTNKFKWCFPGGGKDTFDEPFEEVATRELREEYELDVAPEAWHELLQKEPNQEGEAYGKVFATFVDPGSEVTMHEGKNFAWVPLSDLHEFEFGFGHEEWIPKLTEFTHSHIEQVEQNAEIKPFGKIR